jgi:tRNA-dihydrouridine synthase B
MVSAKALHYGDAKSLDMLAHTPCGAPIAYQLFGSDPEIMAEAVRKLDALEDAGGGRSWGASVKGLDTGAGARDDPARGGKLISCVSYDVNMGCPVPKVVRNGEGSALMRDVDRAARIVEAMARATDKPVTVKIRAGFGLADAGLGGAIAIAPYVDAADTEAGAADDAERGGGAIAIAPYVDAADTEAGGADDAGLGGGAIAIAPYFARAMEQAGAAAIAVHGRTREQYYSGKADWDVVARVKDSVGVPVIGSGDVMSAADARRMLCETGCDFVMIARGALGNPWIFEEAAALGDRGGADVAHEDAAALGGGGADVAGRGGADVAHEDGTALDGGGADVDGRGGAPLCGVTARDRAAMFIRHARMLEDDKGEYIAVREMRKHAGWYFKGRRGASALRAKVNTAASMAELVALVEAMYERGA